MKRYAVVTVGVSASLVLLAGCASSSGNSGSGQDEGVTTLTFSMWAGSAPETEALETLVGMVEEEHPDIKLKLEKAG